MASLRLSALDDSFLAVENDRAHMHVGWAASLEPGSRWSRPSFAELREHIGRRLGRSPRCRQVLAPVPLGVTAPEWVDCEDFDVADHVIESKAETLTELVDECMSRPLDRDKPLWEMWVARQLKDGNVGVVGKAHHCMVDGIAAVELASLLLDATPDPPAEKPETWSPDPAPLGAERLAVAVRDAAAGQARAARAALGSVASPRRAFRLPGRAARAARALAHAARPARPVEPLNAPISSRRHLAAFKRPLGDLREIKQRFGTTVNDVLLASSAGALRRFFERRGQEPADLKTMVPVNVRDGDGGELGNRISFMFVDLPCREPSALRRLERVHEATSRRKEGQEPEAGDVVLRAVGHAPRPLQHLISRLVATPMAFNLTVSNIPGPPGDLYMLGCKLTEAYPVVPIADRHAMSIGMTTVGDTACFGIYTDPESLPDADRLSEAMDASIDELAAV